MTTDRPSRNNPAAEKVNAKVFAFSAGFCAALTKPFGTQSGSVKVWFDLSHR